MWVHGLSPSLPLRAAVSRHRESQGDLRPQVSVTFLGSLESRAHW